MRILLTTDTIGGVWTFTRELTSELLRRGHSVALVSFGSEPSKEHRTWTKTQMQAFPGSFEFSASLAPLEWMQANEKTRELGAADLLRIADRFQPEVFHSNQLCWGALGLRVPKLITAHSDVLSWASACRPDGLEPSPWLIRYLELVNTGLRGADMLVTPTRWMASALRQHYDDLPPIRSILNGRQVDAPDVFGNRSAQVVTVGRLWDEAKNVSMLRHVASPWPILVAGEQRHEQNALSDVNGAMTLLGHMDEASIFHLFRCSCVYVATSVYEPFGLAPLEAALCGCAILANDIPSFREVWGEAALYFHDASSLSAQLFRLSHDHASLMQAQARAQARARHLTARRMVDQYENLYCEMTALHLAESAIRHAGARQEYAVHAA